MPALRSLLLVLAAAAPWAPLPAAVAQPSAAACAGTLLELQVQQRGSASFDRFRFNLGLEAEAAAKADALAQLNQRLRAVRAALAPLVAGDLTIPAPSTYRTGGGSGPGATPWRERASTTVSGVVSKANYNALIQAAGQLPGVNLQGFTALAASGSEAELEASLIRRALAEGKRQAQSTAQALGLREVRLLRINQRGDAAPRPLPYAMAAARGFSPEEAPAPQAVVALALDYCLV